jgi:hypothetical protein
VSQSPGGSSSVRKASPASGGASKPPAAASSPRAPAAASSSTPAPPSRRQRVNALKDLRSVLRTALGKCHSLKIKKSYEAGVDALEVELAQLSLDEGSSGGAAPHAVDADVARLSKDIKDLEARKLRREKSKAELETVCAGLADKKATAIANRDLLQSQLTTLEQENADLKKSLETGAATQASQAQQLTTLTADLAALQLDVTAAEKTVDSTRRKLQEVNNVVANIRNQVAAARAEETSLQVDLNAIKTRSDALKATITTNGLEEIGLLTDAKQTSDQVQTLKTQKENVAAKIRAAQRELGALHAELSNAQKEVADAEEQFNLQITALTNQLDGKSQSLANLQVAVRQSSPASASGPGSPPFTQAFVSTGGPASSSQGSSQSGGSQLSTSQVPVGPLLPAPVLMPAPLGVVVALPPGPPKIPQDLTVNPMAVTPSSLPGASSSRSHGGRRERPSGRGSGDTSGRGHGDTSGRGHGSGSSHRTSSRSSRAEGPRGESSSHSSHAARPLSPASKYAKHSHSKDMILRADPAGVPFTTYSSVHRTQEPDIVAQYPPLLDSQDLHHSAGLLGLRYPALLTPEIVAALENEVLIGRSSYDKRLIELQGSTRSSRYQETGDEPGPWYLMGTVIRTNKADYSGRREIITTALDLIPGVSAVRPISEIERTLDPGCLAPGCRLVVLLGDGQRAGVRLVPPENYVSARLVLERSAPGRPFVRCVRFHGPSDVGSYVDRVDYSYLLRDLWGDDLGPGVLKDGFRIVQLEIEGESPPLSFLTLCGGFGQ